MTMNTSMYQLTKNEMIKTTVKLKTTYRYGWTPTEVSTIRRALNGLCADLNNVPMCYEVDVTYYQRDIEHTVLLDPERCDTIYYVQKQLYRNSSGDVVDERIISDESYHRSKLASVVRCMAKIVRR